MSCARPVPGNPACRFQARLRQQLTGMLRTGQALRKAKNGVYCGPLRLLAMEVAEQLNAEGIYCNLLTGQRCWSSQLRRAARALQAPHHAPIATSLG